MFIIFSLFSLSLFSLLFFLSFVWLWGLHNWTWMEQSPNRMGPVLVWSGWRWCWIYLGHIGQLHGGVAFFFFLSISVSCFICLPPIHRPYMLSSSWLTAIIIISINTSTNTTEGGFSPIRYFMRGRSLELTSGCCSTWTHFLIGSLKKDYDWKKDHSTLSPLHQGLG